MDERLRDAPDAEATIALPAPGRRRTPYAHLLDRHAVPADLGALGGLNPLVEAANPILAAVPQIRHALRHPDPPALRARLRQQIGSFERSAKAAGVTQWQLATARFALCAVIDDSAAATPWGRDWGSRGLLVEIEHEASGAEKFFVLLEEAWAKPSENRDLLELFSVCLALGFEGRYRGGEGGRQALSQLRAKLFGALSPDAAGTTPELSAHWRGADVRARRVPGALALWAATGGCAFVLAALYFGYSTALGVRSDPVARDLALLKPVALAGTPPAAAPRAGPPLSAALAEAIGRREVSVSDTARGVRISLRSDELFASGSARLNAAYNDAAGVTAAFNRNVLRVLNRELGADFEPDAFEHHAFYDPGHGRVEMHLVATLPMAVHIPDVGDFELDAGDSILTEISRKYDRAEVDATLGATSLVVEHWFEPEPGEYAVVVGRPD